MAMQLSNVPAGVNSTSGGGPSRRPSLVPSSYCLPPAFTAVHCGQCHGPYPDENVDSLTLAFDQSEQLLPDDREKMNSLDCLCDHKFSHEANDTSFDILPDVIRSRVSQQFKYTEVGVGHTRTPENPCAYSTVGVSRLLNHALHLTACGTRRATFHIRPMGPSEATQGTSEADVHLMNMDFPRYSSEGTPIKHSSHGSSCSLNLRKRSHCMAFNTK